MHLKIQIKKCKPFSTNNSRVMHLFSIFQSMFLVFIIPRSMHQQVTKCLRIRKAYNYYCSENTHIVTNTVLKEGEIRGCSILKLAYDHFDTHETPHYNTIFNHLIDRLPYQYVLQIPSLCLCYVCAHMCLHNVCVWIHWYIYTHK